MKHFYPLLLLTFSLLLAACETGSPDTTPNPINLKASAPKNYTVVLSWQAQSDSMRLERKTESGDFVTIATVTGQTTFEDFPVFDDATYTYRLNSGTQQSEVTIKVPAVTPNALSVTLTPETDKSVEQTVGATGGSISATGTNGVVYTLTIPEDALLRDTDITLTPVSQIGNLPLGGFLGAVRIEPEDLEFYNYTTLTMTSTSAAPSGMKAVGFSSSNTGQEFYLHPFASSNPPSSALQAQQDDDELAPLRPIKGGTYGAGAGTAEEVKKQIQDHPPTDPTAQTQQQTAYDDDLAPLTPARVIASGWATRLALKELNRPSKDTLAVFKEFRQWLEYLRKHNLEKEFDTQIKAHSKRQATRISTRFDELYQQCEAGDRSVRKEMKELFYWAKLYPAIVQNLGPQWFTEAQDRIDLCGIPNWEGAASASQPEAFLNGYSGSAEITYELSEVDGDLVTYQARASNLRFDMASDSRCSATVTSLEANTEPERSFLTIDYSTKPATYSAGFFLNVSYTITCPDGSQSYSNVPFPILFGFDGEGLLSDNNRMLTGTYEVPGTTYSSTWTLNAIPRSK